MERPSLPRNIGRDRVVIHKFPFQPTVATNEPFCVGLVLRRLPVRSTSPVYVPKARGLALPPGHTIERLESNFSRFRTLPDDIELRDAVPRHFRLQRIV